MVPKGIESPVILHPPNRTVNCHLRHDLLEQITTFLSATSSRATSFQQSGLKAFGCLRSKLLHSAICRAENNHEFESCL